jgi:hypothetical protein
MLKFLPVFVLLLGTGSLSYSAIVPDQAEPSAAYHSLQQPIAQQPVNPVLYHSSAAASQGHASSSKSPESTSSSEAETE